MLLRKLLENNEFKNEFVQRFATQINTIFETSRAQAIADSRRDEALPDLQAHFDRWNGVLDIIYGKPYTINMERWQEEYDYLQDWFVQRPGYVRQHIEDHFGLSGRYILNIPVDTNTNGHVFLNENEYLAPPGYW